MILITLYLLIISFFSNYDATTEAVKDKAFSDILEYVLLDEKHPCQRKCTPNATPMTCRYNFTIEWYNSLSKACYDCPFVPEDCFRKDCVSGGGYKRPIAVVNRRIPGPTIEVCLGDEVIIDVNNQLASESTTIHWHGHHQRFNPYMDGVPFVTQCPIQPGTTFRYQFKVLNPGTHFWHSHSGFQRADGAFGAFIVRIPEEYDPHSGLYDYDLAGHVISILDWGREIGLDKFVAHHHSDGDNKPAGILINGLGRFQEFRRDNETVYTPIARFTVEQGYRYRFRVVNAGFLNCPVTVSVDNHTLTVISSDGNDFSPVKVESFVTYAGERFDFILNADQSKDVYWVRFQGLMDCDERFQSAHQVAVLQYFESSGFPEGTPNYQMAIREGIQVNPLNKGIEADDSLFLSLPKLRALDDWDDSLKKVPDFRYYVSYDFYKTDNPHFHKAPFYGFRNMTDKKKQLLTPQLNHISMKLLPFPLLSQRHEIREEMTCNETTVTNCRHDFCECTHIVNIPLNSVVEMVLIDKGFAFDANHPFHIHGHSFRVIAMEKIGKNVTVGEVLRRDKQGLIKRNLRNAPIKDTVTVPDGGFTIVRFKASNPGYWLFHCHIEFHIEVGMALVFKIGEDAEMPPVPHDFPKCGNYYPSNASEDTCLGNNTVQKIIKSLLPKVYQEYCLISNKVPTLKMDTRIVLFLFILVKASFSVFSL